jgi:hypothetical protein
MSTSDDRRRQGDAWDVSRYTTISVSDAVGTGDALAAIMEGLPTLMQQARDSVRARRGPQTGELAALAPGPKARGKWLARSVRRDPAEVIAAMFGEAGPHSVLEYRSPADYESQRHENVGRVA